MQIHVGVFKKIFYKKGEKLEPGGIFIYMQMYEKRINLILKKASRRKENSKARIGRITVTEDET